MSSPISPRFCLRDVCRFQLSKIALFRLVIFVSILTGGSSLHAELRIGAAEVNITPPLPVALSGQFHLRLAEKIETPVTASVVVLEKTDESGKSIDQAIMVACDLVAIRDGIIDKVRDAVAARKLEGLDPAKIFLSATHTHTAPVMRENAYPIPKEGVTQPSEFVAFLCDKVATAIESAWKSRKAGAAGWGLGHALVGHNRRAAYLDGRSQMYGSTSSANFKGLEGYEDHGVEVLFFWQGEEENPVAVAVNVACPAQVVEGRSNVNADYWHYVREGLAEKFGSDVVVLGWVGAAGDQVPRPMLRKKAESRMIEARGLSQLEEVSRRIVRAVEDAWAVAKEERHADPVLEHRVAELILPKRMVTDEEVASAKAEIKKLRSGPPEEIQKNMKRWLWHQKTVDRHAEQADDPALPMEMHAIRIGDIAICTNRFELFTEYGMRIKGRSPALQTFVIQLAGPGSYLATDEAEAGGGYSAIVNSCLIGPDGGQMLVDESVKAIDAMWKGE
ncbi:MAG: hypothetical protein ACKVJU_24345 [Verrucomicrobiales bacterium]